MQRSIVDSVAPSASRHLVVPVRPISLRRGRCCKNKTRHCLKSMIWQGFWTGCCRPVTGAGWGCWLVAWSDFTR